MKSCFFIAQQYVRSSLCGEWSVGIVVHWIESVCPLEGRGTETKKLFIILYIISPTVKQNISQVNMIRRNASEDYLQHCWNHYLLLLLQWRITHMHLFLKVISKYYSTLPIWMIMSLTILRLPSQCNFWMGLKDSVILCAQLTNDLQKVTANICIIYFF